MGEMIDAIKLSLQPYKEFAWIGGIRRRIAPKRFMRGRPYKNGELVKPLRWKYHSKKG
jgi:hypothetical protein